MHHIWSAHPSGGAHSIITRGRGRGRAVTALLGAGVLAAAMIPSAVLASHPEVSLPGSNFEIDTNANLKVDDAGTVDRLGQRHRDPKGGQAHRCH